jgi:two-component system KDP operon response regulator KdpE
MTRAMHRVLAIESHAAMRDALRALLTTANYQFVGAETAFRGEVEARAHRPDLLIASLDLPEGDGIELIKRVRAGSAVPVIALSSHSSATQKIAALDAGADDYVTRPFGDPELLARMRAVLRRTATGTLRSWEIRLGERVIDLARRELRGAAAQVRLTRLEFRVLENLAQQSGSIISQDRLMRQVWGSAQLDDTRSLRVCIHNLRSKLEPDARRPRYLVTERGSGYRLRADDHRAGGP